ncbi:MAG: hypothetical protein JXL80_10225 [Planctomycetes bacterium]|nr:hypothetical protein [Planctomycetota bacterium]
MIIFRELSIAAILVLAAVGLLSALPGGSAAVLADDQSTTESDKTAKPQDEKIHDSPGELFPGVKGVSGAELAKRIAAAEKRKQNKSQPTPVTPAATTPTPATPAQQPAGSGSPSAPAGNSSSSQPSTVAAETAPATAANGSTVDAAASDDQAEAKLSYTARMFLKQFDERVERIDLLLRKAREYRSDAETAAAAIGNEAKIQYYLRHEPETALTAVRNYEKTMMGPISVYRTIYEMTRDALTFAAEKRPPDDLGPEGTAATDKNVARLKEARRECLLAAAELFTKIRRFDASERIYVVLTKMYPNDAAINLSYTAMIRVRDDPMEGLGLFWERGGGGGDGDKHR